MQNSNRYISTTFDSLQLNASSRKVKELKRQRAKDRIKKAQVRAENKLYNQKFKSATAIQRIEVARQKSLSA